MATSGIVHVVTTTQILDALKRVQAKPRVRVKAISRKMPPVGIRWKYKKSTVTGEALVESLFAVRCEHITKANFVRSGYCKSCYQAMWRNNNREKWMRPNHTRVWKTNYGIDLTPHWRRLDAQTHCAICDELLDHRPHIDHNHSTKVVRDKLCCRCNQAVGWRENKKVDSTRLDAYIQKWTSAQGIAA